MCPETIKKGEVVSGITFISERLIRAYNLASEKHKDQKRKSSEPYFTHCFEVFSIVYNEFGIRDENYLIAALLHDTVEDTGLTLFKIKRMFGQKVTDLVEGVTKLEAGDDKDTLSKVINKSYLNPGVAIIKLADRLHNMRTLGYLDENKRYQKAKETMEVYTKLAESLGIWVVKTELEDLSYQYLNPKEYLETKEEIDNDPRRSPLFMAYVKSGLEKLLYENNYQFNVDTKLKGYWNLKHKQKKDSLEGKCDPDNFLNINDLISFRVVLPTIDDCYLFLRILHDKFGETVDYERFDEFIGANKRINGYEAIQTTINSNQGPIEIAIVTPEMEEFNTTGVLSLIKKKDIKRLKDYVLKLVFTPGGGIKFLPEGGTGVDFASLVNPRLLADTKENMLVDGEEVPVSSIIPNASTVEIQTYPESVRAPRFLLEKYCTLPETRKIISKQRTLEKKDMCITKGRKILEEVLAPKGVFDLDCLGSMIKPVLYNLGCGNCDELYFLVGNGALDLKELKQQLNRYKITKNNLQLTSIKLNGPNHPKILVDIIQQISDMGANIINIFQEIDGDNFNLRIVVKGLVPEENNEKADNKESILREKLKDDPRFILSRVV